MKNQSEAVNGNSQLKWLLIGLFFLWMAISLAGYYLVQNAILQPVFQALPEISWVPIRFEIGQIARNILDLIAGLWIAFVALGSGRWCLARFCPAGVDPLASLLFGTGLGLGVLGLLGLLLGLAGLLQQAVFLGLTLLLTVVTGRQSVHFLRDLVRDWIVGQKGPRWIIVIYLIVTLGLALMLALLPPTSWDGLFYHLTGPRLYLEAGRIRPGIDIPHLNFPALMEMLFMYGMALRGDVTAVTLHFIFALLLAGLVYMMTRRYLPAGSGWLAVLFFFSMPMVADLAGWAYNDLALAFYEVAALYALLRWREGMANQEPKTTEKDISPGGPLSWSSRFNSGWLLVAGLFTGLAMSLKYTSVVALVTFLLLITWWGRRDLRRAVRPLLLFVGLAVIIAAPWYLKNLVFTGNPVYPFIFGGDYWDDFRASAYSESGTGIAFNPERCPGEAVAFLVGQHPAGCAVDPLYLGRQLLFLPFNLTMGHRDASFDGNPGPLFLVFLPLLLFYVLFRRGQANLIAFNSLAFFALAQYVLWTVGVMSSAALWQSRLLLPAFVAMCPILAWLLADLARFDHPRLSLQRLLGLVIGGVLVAGLFFQFFRWIPQQSWAYLIGAESRTGYLERWLGSHYESMMAINDNLSQGDVVTFLWEPRSYYCAKDCRPDSILDKFGHLQYLHRDAAGITAAWHEQGISHVLLFRRGLDFILQANSPTDDPLPEPEVWVELRENYLELIATIGEDVYELYLVK